jgi:hypothetical protein
MRVAALARCPEQTDVGSRLDPHRNLFGLVVGEERELRRVIDVGEHGSRRVGDHERAL